MERAEAHLLRRYTRAIRGLVRHGLALTGLLQRMATSLAEYAGMHLDVFQRLVIDPASVSAVALGDGAPRIVRVNDVGSLASLAPRRASSRRQVGD